MKLLAIYTVFNGIEILPHSIKAIRPFVDEVLIIKQRTSNRGNYMPSEDMETIINLDASLIHFEPKLHLNAKENERMKFQIGIDWAKLHNYTHFILLATDHIYEKKHLETAIDLYQKNPVDVTATLMYTYYKYPTWRLTPIENYLMPFICRIHDDTHVVRESKYPFVCDPSVRIKPADSFMVYNREEIMLHHYSMVRKDIRNKFENAAASVNWKNKIEDFVKEYDNYDIQDNPGVSYFGGRKIEVVKDIFKLPIFDE